jgi:nucleoside-diphosphate-sugar epimerase
MEIAVTGGNGRLGRALISFLLGRGDHIRSLDWSDTPHPAETGPQQRNLKLDLKDLPVVMDALRGCDAVIHLAAFPGPYGPPPGVVYTNNTTASYNVLLVCAALGIRHVGLASSINALGGIASKVGHFDYFPVDEKHPTYNEDDYSLSKWVMEQQADSFARRAPGMTISSLRLHALPDDPPTAGHILETAEAPSARGLWGWTLMREAVRACALTATADFSGHEVFFVTAPITSSTVPSLELARYAYPGVPVRGDLSDHKSFYNCTKAARLLGWSHAETPIS